MTLYRSTILSLMAWSLLLGQQTQNTFATRHPIKVAMILDQTLSTLSMRVQMPSKEELEPLLEFLADYGGEVAVGVIRDRSNASLVRCRLEERPVYNVIPPDPTANVFVRQKQETAYKTAQEHYVIRVANWHDENQKRLAIFRSELVAILSRPIDAFATDINGAIRRADLFLAEPDEVWAQPLRRYAVYVTDGIDNVRAPAAEVRSDATVLMVNGSTHLGTLATLKPVRMESFSAAVRYIINEQKRSSK